MIELSWQQWVTIGLGVWVLLLSTAVVICLYRSYNTNAATNTVENDPLPIQRGGTGVTTIADLKAKLNVKDVASIAQGGTGVSNIYALKAALGIASGVQTPFSYAGPGNATDAALVNPTMFRDSFGNTYNITGYSTEQTTYVDIIGQIKGNIVSASQTALQGKLPFPVDPSSRVAIGGVIGCWAGRPDDGATWAASAANGWIVQQTNGSVYIYVKWNFSLSPAVVGHSMIITYTVRLYST